MRTRALAEAWLASRLSTESVTTAGATGVYRYPAPLAATYPFITVAVDGIPRPVRALGSAAELLERITYSVEAWDRGGSADTASDISAAVFAALDGEGPVSVSGGEIISCRYIGASRQDVAVSEGETYQRSGGKFELFVKTNTTE